MYFLEKKQFKPSVILLSVIFLPIIITIIIAICLTFKKELLLALFTIVLIYSVLIIVFWKISQCKNGIVKICGVEKCPKSVRR